MRICDVLSLPICPGLSVPFFRRSVPLFRRSVPGQKIPPLITKRDSKSFLWDRSANFFLEPGQKCKFATFCPTTRDTTSSTTKGASVVEHIDSLRFDMLLAITESWLTCDAVIGAACSLGYTAMYRPRPLTGGGVAFIFKNTIVQRLDKIVTDTYEILYLLVATRRTSQTFQMLNVYRPRLLLHSASCPSSSPPSNPSSHQLAEFLIYW